MTRTATRPATSLAIAMAAAVSCCSVACGQLVSLQKLFADDAAADSYFGHPVALAGDVAVIGAKFSDVGGVDRAGAAYLFDIRSGKQLHKLVPADPVVTLEFGTRVDITPGTAIVATNNPVTACLFDTGSGAQLRALLPVDVTDWTNISVAIDGSHALVGAPRDDEQGPDAGALYVFDVATGKQLRKIFAEDSGGAYGIAIDLEGATALVGAQDHASGRGAAYVVDVTTGTQLHKLEAVDGAGGDRFGWAVAIDSGRAIVGARFHDHVQNNDGAAYLFDVATGAHLRELTPDVSVLNERVGSMVALLGDTAIANRYVFDAESGAELQQLSSGVPDDGFLDSAALSGSLALIGASRDDEAATDAGAAYVFGPPCPGDVDGSRVVDVTDLLLLLATWGPCPGCAADLDGNGAVDVSDLLVVLGGWGVCPG